MSHFQKKISARQLGARGTNAVLGVDPSNEMLRRGVVKAGRRTIYRPAVGPTVGI